MRVTERAQRAITYAQDEAGRLGHDHVGTEHLLLGVLRDQEGRAAVTLASLAISLETIRGRVEGALGRGPAELGRGLHPRMTNSANVALGLAGREAMRLEHDRVGTEHLLLGLACEGESGAARILEELGAGLLRLREAVAAQHAAGVEPEPFPPDRGPPSWQPPPSATLRRVVPLARQHPLPSGDQLVLLSLELWSDWFDLRYAVVYATPEPEGDLPRPPVVGTCEVTDPAGTAYNNRMTTSPNYGPIRIRQHTFVPAPPEGTEQLELRFRVPFTGSLEASEARPTLLVATVDLRSP